MTHWIRLDGEDLGFAAAHFAAYGGDLEPLHGHNYRVMVELSGALTGDAWVMDFGRVKHVVRDICTTLDHRFLLQRNSGELRSRQVEGERIIEFGSRRYVMPEGDVVDMPIDNTTAERLAEWFAGRVSEELRRSGEELVEHLRVGVEEGPGQSGWFSLPLVR
jgi:6-pyruvoyltetrahydropterin/6-carboxytetrahydropterin synthase